MQNSDIRNVEDSIKRANFHIEAGKAVDRLRNNKDFKQIVVEGYFEREAVRLVHLKGAPDMQSDAAQSSIVKQMDAIAAFSQYLSVTGLHAAMAQNQIVGDQETLAELLYEELNWWAPLE